MRADYLRNSDDTVLAERPKLDFEEGEHGVKIVVKNSEGDPVLIFPKCAVSQKIQHEDDLTKIDLYVTYSMNPNRQVLFKFGFPTLSQASSLNELLNYVAA